MADEGFEGGTGERGDGWHMRMGLSDTRESSEVMGEVRREQGWICHWNKAPRGKAAQGEGGSYSKASSSSRRKSLRRLRGGVGCTKV